MYPNVFSPAKGCVPDVVVFVPGRASSCNTRVPKIRRKSIWGKSLLVIVKTVPSAVKNVPLCDVPVKDGKPSTLS